jgi:hypothetical protein
MLLELVRAARHVDATELCYIRGFAKHNFMGNMLELLLWYVIYAVFIHIFILVV